MESSRSRIKTPRMVRLMSGLKEEDEEKEREKQRLSSWREGRLGGTSASCLLPPVSHGFQDQA